MKKIEYLNKQEVTIGLKKTLKVTVVIGLLSCLIVILNTFMPAMEVANAKTSQTGEWVTRITGPMGQRQKISLVSDNDGWFLQFDASNIAYLARYNGFTWNIPVNGSVGHSQLIVMADIEMLSPTDGWLVLGGEIGATMAQSSIYRWDGTDWNFVTTLTDPNGVSLSSLSVLGPNDVWALGGGQFWANLYHWDGNSWSFAGKTPGGVWAGSDLAMLSANNGWAVGMDGAITHWDGNEWSQVASGTSSNLNAIAMISNDEGWIVGDNGTIQHWNGTNWASYSSPTTANLYSIDMVSADEGWAVGESVILNWDGNQWSNFTSPRTDRFNDIEMSSAQGGWIIGNGSLLEYQTDDPKVTILSYSSGAPGSYFNVLGQNFPPDTMAEIVVNGRSLGTVPVTSNGRFAFTLTTANADEGVYFLTVSVNPSVTKQFVLDATEPVRPPDNPADTFDVPAGVAFTEFVYLPAVIR